MAQLPAKNLGLVVDGARLRDAIDILLEDGGFLQKHWLLKVIDHLPREPNWNRIREQGNGALEEIINIAKQDKQAALDLIEEVSSFTNHVVRPTLRGRDERKELNKFKRRRQLLAENAKKYKDRVRNAILAREFELGYRLNQKERQQYLYQLQDEWKLGLRERVRTSVGVPRQQIQREYAEELNQHYQKLVDEGMAKAQKQD